MADFPSIIGKCNAFVARNSGLRFNRVGVAVSIQQDYSQVITDTLTDPPYTVTTSTLTISRSLTGSTEWTREKYLPHYANDPATDPPEGKFYLTQFGCCCPCRSVFAGRIFAPSVTGIQTTIENGSTTTDPDNTQDMEVVFWGLSGLPCKKSPDETGEEVTVIIKGIPVMYGYSGTDPDGLVLDSNVTAAILTAEEGGSLFTAAAKLTGLKPCDTSQEYTVSAHNEESTTEDQPDQSEGGVSFDRTIAVTQSVNTEVTITIDDAA